MPKLPFLLAIVPTAAFASQGADHGDPVAAVVLALTIILVAAKLGGELAVRVGQSAVLGELLVLAVVTGLIGAADRGASFGVASVAVIVLKATAFLALSLFLGVRWSPKLFHLASKLHARGVLLALGLTLAGKPVIDRGTFSAVVVMVIVTTLVTPIALKLSLQRKVRGSVPHS